MIDLYCERLGPGLWAEPFNLMSNMAFLVSGWAAWRISRSREINVLEVNILIAIAFAIGIGSGLFHAFATPITNILDVVPIMLFQLLYLWTYCSRVIRLHNLFIVILVGAYLLMSLWAGQFTYILNGSLSYAPALAVLVVLGCHHYLAKRHDRSSLLFAAGVFSFSLAFRIIDEVVCPYWSFGTHFIWHLLNAILLYILIKGLLATVPGWDTNRNLPGMK